MSSDEKSLSRAAKALSVLLAVLPPARMAWIVFTNGDRPGFYFDKDKAIIPSR